MSEIIAVAGKGGTGKTSFAALLVLDLARRRQGAVLAIDADPNSNLADLVGVKDSASIADVVDSVARDPEIVPKNMGKDAYVEYQIHKDIAESDGFDLLTMGRPEGPGCYCYINNVLRSVMERLVSDYSFVVVDNEAGMEHFSRKTTRQCSRLFVVSDATEVGLRSAHRIFGLIQELGIPTQHNYLVVNRVQAHIDAKALKKDFQVEEVFVVPFDEKISEASVKGTPLNGIPETSEARTAILKVGDLICRKT